jgi:hypothetical protein
VRGRVDFVALARALGYLRTSGILTPSEQQEFAMDALAKAVTRDVQEPAAR